MARKVMTTKEKQLKANQRKEVSKIVRQNASALVSRLQLASKLGKSFGGLRDTYESFGYPKVLDYTIFKNFYDRDGIATRVVDIISDETWRINPVLVEDGEKKIGENDDPGELQTAFSQMADNFDLYTVFNDVDAACGISRFGLILLGLDGKLDTPAQPGTRLNYVTYRDEGTAIVEEQSIILDVTSPRYGQPEYYQIVVDERTMHSMRVHHSRIIHVREGRSPSRVFGVPRLQKLINRFYDLEKVVGAGSEAFWQLIHRGMTFTAKDDASLPSVDSSEFKAMQDEIDEYMHNLRRYMRLQGVEAQDLGGKPVDNMNQFDSIISYISGSTGIPKRILLGAEAGQLASSQDQENFAKSIETRREKFAEPRILRPYVKRMQEYQLLPQAEKYQTQWGSLFTPTDSEKAGIASTVATAINTASGGAPETIMAGDVFAERYLDYVKPPVDPAEELRNMGAELGLGLVDTVTPKIADAVSGQGSIEDRIKAALSSGGSGADKIAQALGGQSSQINLTALKPAGSSNSVLDALRNNVYLKLNTDNSAMVCFDIPQVIKDELVGKYSFITPDIANDLHVTLVYLGDYRTLDVSNVIMALDAFASIQQPVKGELQGIARFVGSGDEDAFVATFDSPDMPLLYTRLSSCLDMVGVPYHKEHGFIPHVTLAYIGKDAPMPVDTIDPIELNFDKVYLALGDSWKEIKLNADEYSFALAGDLKANGGEGSGNFGHAGRPGKQGGSEERSKLSGKLLERVDELASILAQKLREKKIERGYVVDSEGEHLSGAQIGGKFEISLRAGKGEVTIHSHPLNKAHSMMDVYNAAEDELAACVVVTESKIYILEPGDNGWSTAKEKVRQYDPHTMTSQIADDFGLVLTEKDIVKTNAANTETVTLEDFLAWKARILPVPGVKLNGGEGSGNFGHAGRPGKEGGSSASGGKNTGSAVKYMKTVEKLDGVFPNPLDPRSLAFTDGKGNLMASVQLQKGWDRDGVQTVSFNVYVPPEDRKKGYGSVVVKKLMDTADKEGIILTGHVDPFGNKKGMSAKQLAKWYQSLGFTLGDKPGEYGSILYFPKE